MRSKELSLNVNNVSQIFVAYGFGFKRYFFFLISDCMGVRDVKPIFQDNVENIGSRECMVLPTSGLTGDGVTEGIEWLVQCIKRNIFERPPQNEKSEH